MNCKNCQEPLLDGSVFCHKCGAQQTEPVQEETTPASVEETAEIPTEQTLVAPAEEIAEAPVEEVTEVATEETVEEAPAAPKKKLWVRIVAIVCAVAVVLGIAAGVWYYVNDGFMPKENDIHAKSNYTVSNEQIAKVADKVIATVGNMELANSQLQVQYWMQFYNFVSQNSYYLSYYGLDHTQPLADQPMTLVEGDLSWEQYFLQRALNNWHQCKALALAAEAEGYQISDEVQAYLDGAKEAMEANAISYGYANADEMIAKEMGYGCTLEDYLEYLAIYARAEDYLNYRYGSMEPTEEEIEAFVDANAELMQTNYGVTKDSGKLVDVRHILVAPQGTTDETTGETTYTEEDWEACRAKAQEILDEWLAGAADEDSFAELAGVYSEDGGSYSNGGLYTDVYVGKMVEPFEQWCFDETRQYGDSGLVRTEYGYHIMFYVAGEEGWLRYGKDALINDLYSAFMDEIMKTYPLEVNYKAISLGKSSLLEESGEETEPTTAAATN